MHSPEKSLIVYKLAEIVYCNENPNFLGQFCLAFILYIKKFHFILKIRYVNIFAMKKFVKKFSSQRRKQFLNYYIILHLFSSYPYNDKNRRLINYVVLIVKNVQENLH